jgi:hypothetical protein
MTTGAVQVTQRELQEICELQREVSQKQAHLDELKSSVKVLLIHKMPVELGRFDARLITKPHRSVPWKKCVVDNLGVEFAESFRKSFPVHVFFDVAVEEHAVPPLWKDGANSIEV